MSSHASYYVKISLQVRAGVWSFRFPHGAIGRCAERAGHIAIRSKTCGEDDFAQTVADGIDIVVLFVLFACGEMHVSWSIECNEILSSMNVH